MPSNEYHEFRVKYQPEAKKILFYTSWFDLIDMLFFIITNDSEGWFCALQASTIQFFNVGSKIWETCLAIEIWIIVHQIDMKVNHYSSVTKKNTKYRHGIYWITVIVHGVVTVAIMLSLRLWSLNLDWCWLSQPDLRIYFCYLQIWLGTAIILYCNTSTCVTMRRLIRQSDFLQTHQEHESDMSHSDSQSDLVLSSSQNTKKNDKKLQHFYTRMYFVPIAFIVTQMPGSLRRGYQWQGSIDSLSTREQDELDMAQAILAPGKAFFNMILLVALDPDLREEYYIYFKELYTYVGIALGYDMTINKSLMKDARHESSYTSRGKETPMSNSGIDVEITEFVSNHVNVDVDVNVKANAHTNESPPLTSMNLAKHQISNSNTDT